MLPCVDDPLLTFIVVPIVEFIGESYPGVMSAAFWPLMPQSRGHIHINTSDPFVDPIITPRLLVDEFDVKFAVQVARKGRELFTSNVFEHVVANAYASPANILANGTDAQYESWFKNTSFGASHWVRCSKSSGEGFPNPALQMGSTAMLPHSLGGVVDSHLRFIPS